MQYFFNILLYIILHAASTITYYFSIYYINKFKCIFLFYSAILYLNEDFDGGQFLFANQNFTIQALLEPKCGRLVGFNSGHYHGVLPVTKGRRCAVAMWFTLNPNFDEVNRYTAEDILNNADRVKAVGP